MCNTMPSLCVTRNQIQGLMHARYKQTSAEFIPSTFLTQLFKLRQVTECKLIQGHGGLHKQWKHPKEPRYYCYSIRYCCSPIPTLFLEQNKNPWDSWLTKGLTYFSCEPLTKGRTNPFSCMNATVYPDSSFVGSWFSAQLKTTGFIVTNSGFYFWIYWPA